MRITIYKYHIYVTMYCNFALLLNIYLSKLNLRVVTKYMIKIYTKTKITISRYIGIMYVYFYKISIAYKLYIIY